MSVNGMHIVQGEMTQVVTALRRSRRWSSVTSGAGSMAGHQHAGASLVGGAHPSGLDDQDPLLRCFADLRDVLNSVAGLSDIHPSDFLSPFLEVIRSEQTSGPVTGLALSAVGKFLSYGLIEPDNITAASAVEQIADAVTHARFVGTDHGSDEVVLLKILDVLRTLLLTPVGTLLTNESVCEILQSCFRICFETRLSELLRRAGERTLSDMIQLLFIRLPSFHEDSSDPYVRKLASRAASCFKDPMLIKRKKKYKKHKSTVRKKKEDTVETEEQLQQLNIDGDGQQPPIGVGLEDQSIPRSVPEDTKEFGKVKKSVSVSGPDDGGASCASSRVVDVHDNLITPDEIVSDEEAALVNSPSEENIPGVIVSVASDPDLTSQETAGPAELNNEATQDTLRPEAGGADQDDGNESVGHVSEPEEDPAEFMKPKQRRVNRVGVTFFLDRSANAVTVDGSGGSNAYPEANTLAPAESVTTGCSGTTGSTATGGKPRSAASPVPAMLPYGLPCIRELFRFLISLANPLDAQNTETMIQMGLNLLTVALESGADYIGNYELLMPLVKNDLCRNLLQLLHTERLPLFAGALRACFLMFEALRTHTKLQLESYLTKLMDLVVSENPKIPFEMKEMALEALVQLWRVPGLVTELYLNYDCDLYCSNLFEDLTKLLSKNSFPVAGIYSTHVLSLDALLTVIETIEGNCHYRTLNAMGDVKATTPAPETTGASPVTGEADKGPSAPHMPESTIPVASGYTAGKCIASTQFVQAQQAKIADKGLGQQQSLHYLPQVRSNRMPVNAAMLPSHEDLVVRKKRKRILATGTELFNQSPSKGVKFLQEHGLLATPLAPVEVVEWLKENPRLSKNAIGDYVSNKKNSAVLEAFVESFKFDGVRIDDALRAFLETFRLPGEAPVISMIMEHFSAHWHSSNEDPFASSDAAFTLAFAIIMLNVDQHNLNAKKQNIPMNADQFKKNLSKVNGGDNFDEEMLEDIYHAIKSDEIIMPAEQTGQVKDNYMWKVLLKRSASKDGQFYHAPSGIFDHDLFSLIWGPTVAAMQFVYDKCPDAQDTLVQKALAGFRKCAAIAAHYGASDVFDNLVISLCKFSTLLTPLLPSADDPAAQLSMGPAVHQSHGGRSGRSGTHPIEPGLALALSFGDNVKAQQAARAMFYLVHLHGDILREGWKNILECLIQLYRARLLPAILTDAEDFEDRLGVVSIVPPVGAFSPQTREDSGGGGLFSSLYSLIGSTASSLDLASRAGVPQTDEEVTKMEITQRVIEECALHQIVSDSRYLTGEALSEFFKALVSVSNTYLLSDSPQHRDAQSRGGGTGPGAAGLSSNSGNQYTLVFMLEMMVHVALENKDRLAPYWATIKGHVHRLLTSVPSLDPTDQTGDASGSGEGCDAIIGSDNPATYMLVERAIVDLLRLVGRLLMREELAEEMLQSLSLVLFLPHLELTRHSKQLAFGLHHLLHAHAANVHSPQDWTLLFALLQAAGAACFTWLHPGHRSRQGQLGFPVADRRPSAAGSDSTRATQREPSADRGYTTDPEPHHDHHHHHHESGVTQQLLPRGADGQEGSPSPSTDPGEWTYVNRDGEVMNREVSLKGDVFPFNPNSLVLRDDLYQHNPHAFLKCCESLAFLVRDVAHITPANFYACTDCIKTFVEASFNGGRYTKVSPNAANGGGSAASHSGRAPVHKKSAGASRPTRRRKGKDESRKSKQKTRQAQAAAGGTRSKSPLSGPAGSGSDGGYADVDEDEDDDGGSLDGDDYGDGKRDSEYEAKRLVESYNQVSLQLLDLCHTLHVKTADIFDGWESAGAMEPNGVVGSGISNLWTKCWCPLLQTLARSCTDRRKQIRTTALTYLQRALLMHDLQRLGPTHWEDCFRTVLFPLLARLQDFSLAATASGIAGGSDPIGLEEARCRALALLCKVFLQHLNPLMSLGSFNALWATILEFMRSFYVDAQDHGSGGDILSEAIPESLKNLLLVMDTAGLFGAAPTLFQLTKDRLSAFLPTLIDEVFPNGVRPSHLNPTLSPAPTSVPPSLPVVTSEVAAAPVEPHHQPDVVIPPQSVCDLEEVVVQSPVYIPQPRSDPPQVAPEAQIISTPQTPANYEQDSNVAQEPQQPPPPQQQQQQQPSHYQPVTGSKPYPVEPLPREQGVFQHHQENPMFSAMGIGGVILHPPGNYFSPANLHHQQQQQQQAYQQQTPAALLQQQHQYHQHSTEPVGTAQALTFNTPPPPASNNNNNNSTFVTHDTTPTEQQQQQQQQQ